MRSLFSLFFSLMTLGQLVPYSDANAQTVPTRGGNRLTYLDEFCDPYYPNVDAARLTTPQWIGEKGVDAVITLGIDDMRDPQKYEAYLRPILDRLKKIDGRAPVSIMACQVDPDDKQLQTWLSEGLSLECHTIDHPCPCLQGGDFERAKDTYDRCVDLMNSIPGNGPVAFRFPCMDSLNTPSPKAYAEIVNQKTPNGNFLQVSTSVTCLFTPDDPMLRSHFETGESFDPRRFKKYVPFPSFVNQIKNHPYPYLIGNQCWEFPCTIPDDWQGQNIHRPHNPQTVDDLKAAVDASVTKQGVANIIFHPHGWIRAEQIVEVIDHVEKKYGKRVKFLTFRECLDRINKHLLDNVAVRHRKTGMNPGVRILDLNGDGYQDVFIGTEKMRKYRIWNPAKRNWLEFKHVFDSQKIRFGMMDQRVVVLQEVKAGEFAAWIVSRNGEQIRKAGQLKLDHRTTIDQLRLRDLNLDGRTELIVGASHEKSIFTLELKDVENQKIGDENRLVHFLRVADFPNAIVDKKGNDNGLRFVDLNEDGFDDILISNDQQAAVYLFRPKSTSFEEIDSGTEIPRIVSGGKNGGVWFANRHLWVQNEHTHRLPDGVDRRSFQQILSKTEPGPKSPKSSLDCMQVIDGFRVELMAAEPMVMDPIAMEWGFDGKLWVVEMADYPLGLDDKGKPGGRIRYLEDTNQDGTYDKSTVFIDQIPFPTGVLPTNIDPAKPSCLISAAPYIVQANQESTWNDLIGNEKNLLVSGFGEGNQQHRFNGFSPGLDNWLYLANGDSGGIAKDSKGNEMNLRGLDLRIKPGHPWQMEAQTGQTQFGRHRDAWGNWFGCSNPIPLRHYILPDHYLKRNPHYRFPTPRIDIATSGNTQIFPRSKVLSHWSGYQPPANGQGHRFTSACSTDFYRGTLFGAQFDNNTFTCEPVHNLVHRRITKRNGVQFSSSRPTHESDKEFLASSDSWFRPTTVKTGPDGALWITDMYRLVIEHPEWIDDQEEKRLFLRSGHDRGRIYRVTPVSRSVPPLPTLPSNFMHQRNGMYSQELSDRLLQMLSSENGWSQETAQRFLVQIGTQTEDIEVSDKLMALMQNPIPLVRLHALCTLDGRKEILPEQLLQPLADSHPEIRRHAIRISERFLKADPSPQLLLALQKLANDSDLNVRMQLAFSLGFCSHPTAATLLAEIGDKNFDQKYLVAAVFSSLNGSNIAKVIKEAQSKMANPDFIMALLQQAFRFGKPQLAQDSLSRILAAENPENLATRQLEMVVQIYNAIPKLPSEDRVNLSSLSATLSDSVFRALKQSDSDRRKLAALQLFSRSPFLAKEEIIRFLTNQIDPHVDVQTQTFAIAELARINDPEPARFFVKQWRFVTPEIRRAFFSAILQRPSWARHLLQSILAKKIPVGEVSPSQRNQLLGHTNSEIVKLSKSLFSAGPIMERNANVLRFVNAIGKITRLPNAAHGKSVFEQHCSKCHQLGDVGKPVGPNLITVKDLSVPGLVRAILTPNAAVEDKFRSYLVALDDGRELTGLIESESTTQIRLAAADGTTHELFRSQIEQIKSTGKSLMPERLDQEIKVDDMFDLIHFVQHAVDKLPTARKLKIFSGNHPEVVSSNSKGIFQLTSTNCEISGPQIVFESKYKNLGFWGHVDDQARWKLDHVKPGRYEIYLNYACPVEASGNAFELRIGKKSLKGKVAHTGSWDEYKRHPIGVLDLNVGPKVAWLTALSPLKGFLLDFKSVELVPVPASSTGN